MSAHSTSTSDGDGNVNRSTTRRATSGLGKLGRDGSLATVAGGATLVWAARTVRKNAGRGTLLALAGAALIAVGRRQQRARRSENGADTGITVSLDDDSNEDGDQKRVSDDARAQTTQDLGAGRTVNESRRDDESGAESNPRGTADDADVQQDDGGDVEFVEGREPEAHQEPHLEDDQDPRLGAESDDEPTEVDLSEAAMADEASEATGPQPEQAYPAQEGTDPEPASERSPPRSNEGADSSTDSDTEDEETDEESSEANDGSEETS